MRPVRATCPVRADLRKAEWRQARVRIASQLEAAVGRFVARASAEAVQHVAVVSMGSKQRLVVCRAKVD